MLDLRKIRENPDVIREKLARRHGGDEKAIDHILALDEEIRKLKQQVESLKSERNKVSKEVGAIKSKGGDATEIMARMKVVSNTGCCRQRIAVISARCLPAPQLVNHAKQLLVVTHEGVLEQIVCFRRIELQRRNLVRATIVAQEIQDVGLGCKMPQDEQIGLGTDGVAAEPADHPLQQPMSAELR